MPEPCKILSLDSCQKMCLWAHKKVDLFAPTVWLMALKKENCPKELKKFQTFALFFRCTDSWKGDLTWSLHKWRVQRIEYRLQKFKTKVQIQLARISCRIWNSVCCYVCDISVGRTAKQSHLSDITLTCVIVVVHAYMLCMHNKTSCWCCFYFC